MYTREISPPAATPVEDGIPVFGTWNTAFEKVDLLEIKKPYKFNIPRWMKNYRIKEWESFSAQDEQFMFNAVFCNVRLFRMAQIVFYDKEKKEKFFFRKIFPGTGWKFPVSLSNSLLDCHSSDFYFRIHNWLDSDTIKLDLNIEASGRPALTVHLAYNTNTNDVTPMAVSLGIIPTRSMYAYKSLNPVWGDIVYFGRHISINQDSCSGAFCDYKGYYPYRMYNTICSATGFVSSMTDNSGDVTNSRVGFHIAVNQTRETSKNNENALWQNGQLTLLPPVIITMPNGPDNDWIIQDVEGMVDLVFTPKELNRTNVNLFLIKAEMYTQFGYYNGMLLNSERKQIQIKNFFGVGEKLYLRV